MGSTTILHCVLNVKAIVAAFNQEKALVGAFSVIVKLYRLIDLRHYTGHCAITHGNLQTVPGYEISGLQKRSPLNLHLLL